MISQHFTTIARGISTRIFHRDDSPSIAILDSLCQAAGATAWNILASPDPQATVQLISDKRLDPAAIQQAFNRQVEYRREDIWRAGPLQ
jgi:hypothetical protein